MDRHPASGGSGYIPEKCIVTTQKAEGAVQEIRKTEVTLHIWRFVTRHEANENTWIRNDNNELG